MASAVSTVNEVPANVAGGCTACRWRISAGTWPTFR